MTPGFIFLTGFLAGAGVVTAAVLAAMWTFGGWHADRAAPPLNERDCRDEDIDPATIERMKREAIQERARRNPANRTMFDS